DTDFYACRPCVAAHADRLCRRYPPSRAANRINAPSVPYVWRDNGHHERDRVGISAKAFVAIATPATLALWSYLSSLIITLLIPSAGGHWAVQGPFVLPAALSLHAPVARTAMGVAVAENVSNMLQPFWAVPVVAIAGIRIQRVMGYTAITFVVSLILPHTALSGFGI